MLPKRSRKAAAAPIGERLQLDSLPLGDAAGHLLDLFLLLAAGTRALWLGWRLLARRSLHLLAFFFAQLLCICHFVSILFQKNCFVGSENQPDPR